jgi:glycosyltransferase involved in cell wall biosynthesis
VRRLLLFQASAERKAVLRADLVLATSDYSRRCIGELYGADAARIGIVPPPVDVLGWQREVSAATPAPHAGPVVLAVAHWYPRKNLTTLIRAAAIVVRNFPSCEFRIVGQGPELGAARRLAAALGLRGKVRFLDHVSRAQLAAEYATCDVFCLPSRQEGFGIVFVEAMAAGKPIVALAASSTPELVIPGVNGLLATDDPAAIAACLGRLLSDPSLCATIGATNRGAAARWDTTKTVAIFLTYANRARAASGNA